VQAGFLVGNKLAKGLIFSEGFDKVKITKS